MQFMNKNRDKIKNEHHCSTIGEIGKKGGELWREMSSEDKAVSNTT